MSFQQLPGTLGLLIVTAVSGRAQKTSAKSDEALFFSYWTKVLPGAPAQGKVNQVTVGVTGVSIISVTKCCFSQMLFWLRISWALWPFCCFPGHFFFLKPSGFLLGSRVQQTHPRLSCSAEKEGGKSCVIYELDSTGIFEKA